MSRTFAIFLALFATAVGGGLAWFYLRPRPAEFDIAPNPLPDLAPIKVAAGDWPWWRGPNLDNHSPDPEAPTSWSETKNILWKSPIPGRGHSSPILVGKRIFLTSADEQAQQQVVLCLDRDTGEQLWRKTIHEKNFAGMHALNSHASGTPASDGQRVFVAFANDKKIQVTALDFAGHVLWQKEAGSDDPGSIPSHGFACSVALWGPYVYVTDDCPSRGWIAALNRETGEFGWRMTRRTGTGSYGSPIVTELGGQPLVLLAGNGNVTSYDPKDGHIVWERGGLGEVSANSVTISPTMAFASSGYQQKRILAVKADGAVAWKWERSSEVPYPPTMLWNEGHLFVVSDQGKLNCFNAETGEQKWTQSLRGEYYASPLLVGKHIYACNREGLTTICAASPDEYTEVAKNKLDGSINASPIAIGGRLYIRTDTHLYCIGSR